MLTVETKRDNHARKRKGHYPDLIVRNGGDERLEGRRGVFVLSSVILGHPQLSKRTLGIAEATRIVREVGKNCVRERRKRDALRAGRRRGCDALKYETIAKKTVRAPSM